jgi:hypothetical protein
LVSAVTEACQNVAAGLGALGEEKEEQSGERSHTCFQCLFSGTNMTVLREAKMKGEAENC